MMLYSSVFVLLLLLAVHNVDGRRSFRSQRQRIRGVWNSLTDKVKQQTVDKFKIDVRRFDKEEMLLFPDIAFQSLTNDSIWNIVVHGWRYEGSNKKDWLGIRASLWVERIAKQMIHGDDLLYLNGSINQDRLKPFFVEDESNEKITIKIGERSFQVRTDKQGQFYDEVQVLDDEIKKLKQEQQRTYSVLYEAIGDNKDTAKGIIRLIEPRQGISVISDIDDTIKISEVLDKVRLLANTFIHPFKPVPGKYNNTKILN